MGQYYYPTIINGHIGEATVQYLYSHDYDNGLKLMEHSYIGNNFVNAVYSLIWRQPKVIAWIGDYSFPYSDNKDEPYEQKLPLDVFSQLYDAVMDARKGQGDVQKIHPAPLENNTENVKGRYLINHSQRQYIDMGEYAEAQSWFDGNPWDPWCIDPLPLLTACGNGRGGGDYHDCYPDYDKVGTWALNLLEYNDSFPETYEKVTFGFTEAKKVQE